MNNSEWTLHIELLGKFRIYRTRTKAGKEEQEELGKVLDLDPQTQKLLAILIAKCGFSEPKGYGGLTQRIIGEPSLDMPRQWQGGRVNLAKEWSGKQNEEEAIKSLNDYLSRLRAAFNKITRQRYLQTPEYQVVRDQRGSFLQLENVQEPTEATGVMVSVEGKINGKAFEQSQDDISISQGRSSQRIKLGGPGDVIHLDKVRLTWDRFLEGRLSTPDRNQLRFTLNPPNRPPWQVDIIAFEEAAITGLRRNDLQILQQALRLYQGEFLEHFRQRHLEDWIIEKRDALLSLYLKVVEQAALWFPNVPQHFGPYLLSHFLNRTTEITDVRRALVHQASKKIILIGGFGGIGKTFLGLMVCWHLIKELAFSKFIWISAQQRWIDEKTGEIFEKPEGAAHKAKQMYALSSDELWDNILGAGPRKLPSISNKKEEVKDLLKNERWLIFLDNLEAAANVDRLIRDLRDVLQQSASKVLITSREEPREAHPDVIIPLQGLGRECILELVARVLDDILPRKVHEVPPGAEQIDEFAQGNPLVAQIIAAQLVRHGMVRAWEDVRRELEAARAEVEKLSEVEVQLKDGKVLQGALIGENPTQLTIQADSRQISIKRADIQKVTPVWKGGLYTFIYWGAWQKLSQLSRRVLIYIGKTAVAPVPKEELKIAFFPDPQVLYNNPKLLEERQKDLQDVLGEILGRRPQLDELEQQLDKGLDEALQELGRHYLVESSAHVSQREKRYGVHPLTREFVRSDLPKIWRLLELHS